MKNISEILDYLNTFVSENKKQLFKKTIEHRTNHITVVLEDIFQPHNASAALRSCDIFGIQNVHIIENYNTYKINPKVVMGASKWLTITKYNKSTNNSLKCIEELKKKGYKIIATTPYAHNNLISDFPIDQKTAFFFGTELKGLSTTVFENADGFVKIPMYGFTESLNISVSVAITLYEVTKRLKESDIPWQLSEKERLEQLFVWTKKIVKSSDLLIEKFNNSK